jgi:hypothetical protein
MSRKRTVFLVLHYEIMMHGSDIYWPDDIVSYVASSLAKALRYIKRVSVEEYSWWKIEEQAVDGMDNPVHIGWYGRRGGKLKAAPYEKAIAAYKKCKADPNHHLNM